MEDWQRNGMVKWDAWQYMFVGEAFKFQANALDESLSKHRELVCREYLKNTDRLIASQETVYEIIDGIVEKISNKQNPSAIIANSNSQLSETFIRGTSQVLSSLSFLQEDINNGFSNISDKLEDISDAIGNLGASFNWGVDRLVWHLSDIKKTIQMPIDNKALNYRMRGINAYQNGWFDEALKEFIQANSYYEYDFITHQYLGDLYLYYKKDLNRALEHFRRAAKYSMVKNASVEHKKISSWAELHIGLVFYKKNDFEEAAQAAYRAATKNPSPEAMYQIGHYMSLTKQKDERLKNILSAFEQAIREDPVYFLKIDMDHNLFERDLYKIRNEMKALKESLFREEREKAWQKISKLKHIFESTKWHYNASTITEIDKMKEDLRLVEEMFKNRQSYLDFRIIQEICGKNI
ncbi:MAG TPA: hypothetical protein P5230_01395 [Candidatus Magasanikbacteria bacterium]|nr:hypothetical protein [Candidatus Magasanikbacteria bacterium]